MWDPKRAPERPVNFILSGKDRTIYAYRNGFLIGQSPPCIYREGPNLAGIFLVPEGTESSANAVLPGMPIHLWTTLAREHQSHPHGVQGMSVSSTRDDHSDNACPQYAGDTV